MVLADLNLPVSDIRDKLEKRLHVDLKDFSIWLQVSSFVRKLFSANISSEILSEITYLDLSGFEYLEFEAIA
jgi:hypothetical protein